jgi:hypothetical protein
MAPNHPLQTPPPTTPGPHQVGLGQPFAEWLLPKIRAYFPDFPDRTAQELYQAENVMRTPSLIRVEADEVGGGHVSAYVYVMLGRGCRFS